MQHMELHACAKINLTLDILGLLPNGYHQMEMIMQSVDLTDTLILHKADMTELVCNQRELVCDQNLVLRAQRLLETAVGKKLPTQFILEKRIPMAAGLAGGSADAAAAFYGLNRLYGLGLTQRRLQELAAALGADIPFSISGGTCLATGAGTQLQSVDNRLRGICLIWMPCRGLSTKEIFESYDSLEQTRHPDTACALAALRQGNWKRFAESAENVLTAAAAKLRPQIVQAIETLRSFDADYAAMTGSGPCVFACFEKEETGRAAYKALRRGGAEVYLCKFTDRSLNEA